MEFSLENNPAFLAWVSSHAGAISNGTWQDPAVMSSLYDTLASQIAENECEAQALQAKKQAILAQTRDIAGLRRRASL